MSLFSPPPDSADVVRRPSPPDRVDPRTYQALNRYEQILEDNHFSEVLRCFRQYWRPHLIGLRADHHLDLSNAFLERIGFRRLYGPWWNPGMLPRRLTDSLIIVHRVIRNTSLEDLFHE